MAATRAKYRIPPAGLWIWRVTTTTGRCPLTRARGVGTAE